MGHDRESHVKVEAKDNMRENVNNRRDDSKAAAAKHRVPAADNTNKPPNNRQRLKLASEQHTAESDTSKVDRKRYRGSEAEIISSSADKKEKEKEGGSTEFRGSTSSSDDYNGRTSTLSAGNGRASSHRRSGTNDSGTKMLKRAHTALKEIMSQLEAAHDPMMGLHATFITLAFLAGYLRLPALLAFSFVFWYFYVTSTARAKKEIDMDRLAERLWRDPECLEKYLLGTLTGIPKWVRDPWVGRVDFLNDFLKATWPHINKGISVVLSNKLGPLLGRHKPSYLSLLELSHVNFGHTPPTAHGIKVFGHRENSSVIDIHGVFVADKNQKIAVSIRSGPVSAVALLENLSINFTVRLTFKRLTSFLPFFHSLTVAFADKPDLKFTLSGAKVKLTSIPGLKSWLENFVSNMLRNKIVWPHEVTVWRANMAKINAKVGISYDEFTDESSTIPTPTKTSGKGHYKGEKGGAGRGEKERVSGGSSGNGGSSKMLLRPQGVLGVTLVEAKDLCSWKEGGAPHPSNAKKKAPHPFAVLSLGPVTRESKKVKNSTHPIWLQNFDMVVYSISLQRLRVEVMDARKRGNQGVLGETYIELDKKVVCGRPQRGEYELSGGNGGGGTVVLVLEWNTFIADDADCEEKKNGKAKVKAAAAAASQGPSKLDFKASSGVISSSSSNSGKHGGSGSGSGSGSGGGSNGGGSANYDGTSQPQQMRKAYIRSPSRLKGFFSPRRAAPTKLTQSPRKRDTWTPARHQEASMSRVISRSPSSSSSQRARSGIYFASPVRDMRSTAVSAPRPDATSSVNNSSDAKYERPLSASASPSAYKTVPYSNTSSAPLQSPQRAVASSGRSGKNLGSGRNDKEEEEEKAGGGGEGQRTSGKKLKGQEDQREGLNNSDKKMSDCSPTALSHSNVDGGGHDEGYEGGRGSGAKKTNGRHEVTSNKRSSADGGDIIISADTNATSPPPPTPTASNYENMSQGVASLTRSQANRHLMQGTDEKGDSRGRGGHSGILQVTVVCASNLFKGSKNKHIDPYVQLSLGRAKRKTSVAWNTTAPVWNESFEFVVADDRKDILEVEVFDKERFRIDPSEGRLRIPIMQIMDLAKSKSPFHIHSCWPMSKSINSLLELEILYFQKQLRAEKFESEAGSRGGTQRHHGDSKSRAGGSSDKGMDDRHLESQKVRGSIDSTVMMETGKGHDGGDGKDKYQDNSPIRGSSRFEMQQLSRGANTDSDGGGGGGGVEAMSRSSSGGGGDASGTGAVVVGGEADVGVAAGGGKKFLKWIPQKLLGWGTRRNKIKGVESAASSSLHRHHHQHHQQQLASPLRTLSPSRASSDDSAPTNGPFPHDSHRRDPHQPLSPPPRSMDKTRASFQLSRRASSPPPLPARRRKSTDYFRKTPPHLMPPEAPKAKAPPAPIIEQSLRATPNLQPLSVSSYASDDLKTSLLSPVSPAPSAPESTTHAKPRETSTGDAEAEGREMDN